MLIYYLCTRERLIKEENDFDYSVMKRQIKQWLKELEASRSDADPRTAVSRKNEASIAKFKKLPSEIQLIIECLLDNKSYAYLSWAEVET